MADNNFVQIELQGDQSKYATQSKVLKIDCKDLDMIICPLKGIQQDSVKILKLYHEYLSEPRKTPGLPYHMIKKFEQLKGSLAKAGNLLQVQCRSFSNEIANRQFDKVNQHHFFKKTLLSYDEKRLWMKNYILSNEKKVQLVEEEVMKNVEYQQHQYTQFLNTIDLERLEHNYHPKLDLMASVGRALQKNCDLRSRIKKKVSQHRQIESKKTESQTDFTSQLRFLKNSFTVCSLFYNLESKLDVYKSFLFNITKNMLKTKSRVLSTNKELKVAIDKVNQMIEQYNLQMLIVMDQYQNISGRERLAGKEKVTKTDYLIYLKQIYRQSQQRIKNFGQYFQYSLTSSINFPNFGKSKSQEKLYPLKLSLDQQPNQKKDLNIQQFIERNHQKRLLLMQEQMERTEKMEDIKLEEEIKEIQKQYIEYQQQQLNFEGS